MAQDVNSDIELMRPALVNAVKTASAQYSGIPDYENVVNDHVDLLIRFFSEMSKKKGV
jgi:hypothetical protein